MIKKLTAFIEILILMTILILCTACHKENTHLPMLVMPINDSDSIFYLNKTENQYYDATSNNESCAGTFLGKTEILGGEEKLTLPKETGLTNRSVAEIAYSHQFFSARDINRIRCIRTRIFGTQNNINYVSNSLDFPVRCSGICPDHCVCTYDGKAENKKAFLRKIK